MARYFIFKIILTLWLRVMGQQECIDDLRSRKYQGNVNVTNHGFVCQTWASQSPHKHPYSDNYRAKFPANETVIEARNYCRDIDIPGRPWCYTQNPRIRWEYCTAVICAGFTVDCGGVFRHKSGLVKTPDSNRDGWHDPFIDCFWTLQADDAHVIRFEIIMYASPPTTGCNLDTLLLFEIGTPHYPFMCQASDKETYGESKSNTLYLHFYSEDVFQAAGFRIAYRQVPALDDDCFFELPTAAGWITAPDNDDNGFYDFNLNCLYAVQGMDDAFYEFQVLYVDVEFSSGCQYDYLRISDGLELLETYCGSMGVQPPDQTTTENMYIRFVSDQFFVATGFNLTYKVFRRAAPPKVSNECLDNLFREPYHGTVHETNTGHVCQPWAWQAPHKHSRKNDEDFPYDGSVLDAGNYCRDFGDFRGRPFCYTTDPGVRWGYCTFIICNISQIDCGDIQLGNDVKYFNVEAPADNYDCLWRIEKPQCVLRYVIQFVDNGDQSECEKYELLTLFDHRAPQEYKLFCNISYFSAPLLTGETRSSSVYLHMYTDSNTATSSISISCKAITSSKKVSQEFLFNQIGWIASPDEDKDSMYDFNVRYVWKVIAAVTTAVVTTDPFVVDLIGTFDEKGACIGDKIKLMDDFGQFGLLCGYYQMSPPVESRSSALIIEFITDDFNSVLFTGDNTNSASGFNISYVINQPDLDCVDMLRYRDYSGTTDRTNHGRQCLVWQDQTHIQIPELDADVSLNWNPCRQYGTSVYPWCYTTDPEILWEYCTFSICPDDPANICEQTVTIESGWIVAPGYESDGFYENSVDCLWNITAPHYRVIQFRIHFIDIESSIGCVKDHLIISQSNDRDDIRQFCGRYMAGSGETVSNLFYVLFYADNKVQTTGFNISYFHSTALEKSYNVSIRNSSGLIYPPDMDGNGLYDYNVRCAWTVEVDRHHMIDVRLSDISMNLWYTRCVDHLLLEDDYTFWFKGCWHWDDTYTFTTATNRLYVYFNSSFFMADTGFTLVFQQIKPKDKTCVEDIESTPYSGTISVTNHGFVCQHWESHHPHIHNFDKDEYFPIDSSVNNASNYCRELRQDGRPWCYTTNPNVQWDYCTFSICTDEGSVCGGVVSDEIGFIGALDSDGDLLYDLNTDCLWLIQPSDGYKVRYKLESYNLEMSDNCFKDFLKIWEDPDRELLVTCGNIEFTNHPIDLFPFEGETVANTLYVKFYSDGSINVERGFLLTFHTLTVSNVSCGGNVTGSSGWIASPDEDNDGWYDFNNDCHWTIEVDPSKSILFQILYVLTDPYQKQDGTVSYSRGTVVYTENQQDLLTACSDRLVIFITNDDVVRDPDIITGCSTNTMDPVLIHGNTVDLFFHSDGFMTGKGFNITWQEHNKSKCGGILNATSGFIVPPDLDGDGIYDAHLRCSWVIEAQEDKMIEYQLLYLDIKESGRCADEELLIWNFAGCVKLGIQEAERPHASRVLVDFYSSFVPEGRGFNISFKQYDRASYDEIATRRRESEQLDMCLCGYGWVSSLDVGEDGSYDPNLGMNWYFHQYKGQMLLLKLLYIDIEISHDCQSDVLQVVLGLWNTFYVCGVGTKIFFHTEIDTSTSILFSTDSSVGGSGFNMTYRAVTSDNAGCGGILKGSSEFLMSEPTQTNCLWTIQLQETKVIVFKIVNILFDENANCDEEYLKVYEEHQEIGKFCGSTVPDDSTSESYILKVDYKSFHVLSGFKAIYFETENDKSCSSNYHCLLSDEVFPLHYLCDEIRDCPNGDDERFCYFSCPEECVCHGLSIDCSGQITCSRPVPTDTGHSITIDLPASTRVLDVSTAPETFRKMNTQQHDEWFIESLNISHCDIIGFTKDFFKPLIRLKILDISYNRIKILTSRLFETQAKLERLILVGNFEALTLESDVFIGTTSLESLEMKDLYIAKITRMAFASQTLKSLKIYNSAIEQIEDYFLEGCSVELLLLNSSKLESFTKTMFHAANEIRLLVTDEYKFCCVRPSYLPEDNCLPHKNEFSSCNDLIESDVLRILVWIVAGFIVVANFCSIINRLKDKDGVKNCFGIFASNLAVSDVLTGIYLIIIGVADIAFRGVYIFYDELWRRGMWCKVASVLSVTACETSALFIALITLDRYLVIKYPFKKQIITPKIGVILTGIVWMLGIFASLSPIGFIEGGLYSQTGICLALPITRAKFGGWGYSFGLFVVCNLLVCLSVVIGQWSIYREIQASAKALAGSKSKSSKASRVAWKLLLVSISDFLCRFPVSLLVKTITPSVLWITRCTVARGRRQRATVHRVIHSTEGVIVLTVAQKGLVASTGVVAVPATVYSWVVITVLPINAVIDPLLYTLSTKLQEKKFHPQPEEEKKEPLLRHHYDKCLDFMRSSSFCQFPGQLNGYMSLSEAIESDWFRVKHRLQVARDITKLLVYIHERRCVQTEFQPSDVCLAHLRKEQDHVKTVLVCRVKRKVKPRDCLENITESGRVLKILTKQK